MSISPSVLAGLDDLVALADWAGLVDLVDLSVLAAPADWAGLSDLLFDLVDLFGSFVLAVLADWACLFDLFDFVCPAVWDGLLDPAASDGVCLSFFDLDFESLAALPLVVFPLAVFSFEDFALALPRLPRAGFVVFGGEEIGIARSGGLFSGAGGAASCVARDVAAPGSAFCSTFSSFFSSFFTCVHVRPRSSERNNP